MSRGGAKRLDPSLNDPSLLEEIARRFWPEKANLSGEARGAFLERLRLHRQPARNPGELAFECERCHGHRYACYSNTSGALQCVDCRDTFFPRAGSLERLAQAEIALSRVVPPPTHTVRCRAICGHAADGYCHAPTQKVWLGAAGNCLGIRPTSDDPIEPSDSVGSIGPVDLRDSADKEGDQR